MSVAPPPNRPHRPLIAAARAVASDATIVIPRQGDYVSATIKLPRVAVDPVDDLVERVRPAVAHAVDALQVAATLEADGITDRAARTGYGYADVFALAEDVFRRLNPGAPTESRTRRRAPWRAGAREISHGGLYLLPAAVFPAVLSAVGTRSLVLALVLAGALGWVWAGGASWLAFRRVGAGDPVAGGRVLRFSVYTGIPAAGVLGAGVVLAGVLGGSGPARYSLIALVLGQMTYQMASTLLMFHKREGLLLVAMLPAVLGGLAFLLLGQPAQQPALLVGALAVLMTLWFGLRETRRVGRGTDGAPVTTGPIWRPGDGLGFGWAVLYAALSAGYLLQAQSRYVLGHLDVALAAGPLIVAMGVVEWRARRFSELGRELLTRVRYPREFASRMWLNIAAGVAVCTGAVVVAAIPLLLVLRAQGLLSTAGVYMAAAHAALAGAYFLGFILAGQGRNAVLCAALGIALCVHTVVGALVRPIGGAAADTAVFLGSAVLLQVLFVVGLAPILGQVRRYR